MGVKIAADVFPAVADLSNGTRINNARVIVTDEKVLVFVAEGGAPKLFYERDLVSYVGGTKVRGIRVQVEDGDVLFSKKPGDCGCGNPLRSFNPFPGETKMLIRL